MSGAIRARRAGRAELDALAPLFEGYRGFYGRAPDPDAARAFLAERLQREDSVIVLAEVDAQPAGFTQLYPIFSSLGMARTWLLNDLFVAAWARRRGVASALLAAARGIGEETGAAGLLLQTTVDNRPAQALYARSGWVRQDGFYWYELDLAAKR